MDRLNLNGKVAVVTGASSGLGWHFAEVLARAGAKVAIGARRVEALQELTRQIEAFDGRAIPAPLDVTDSESVRAFVESAETELGPITVLVNNAGTAISKPLLEHAEEEWDRVVDTNLKGLWLMSQEVARHMVRLDHGGSIINIGSILGLRATGRVPSYCASKAAVDNLTRAMAIDLAPHNIRVNALAPGYIETDLNRAFVNSAAGEALKQRVPQQRFGQPEDLDGPLLLLASDSSRHMTGATIVVDGGHSAVI